MYQEAVMHVKIHGGLLATEISCHVIQLLTLQDGSSSEIYISEFISMLHVSFPPEAPQRSSPLGMVSRTAFLVQVEGATMSTCCS